MVYELIIVNGIAGIGAIAAGMVHMNYDYKNEDIII